MAQWLHYAYQNHNIPPGILMGIRSVNEPIPEGERVFMMASDKEALEEGQLEGSLKTVAQGLDEDDNPVIMVVRFR